MRAVRFAAALEFALDPETERGIPPALPSLAKVSKERICDELRKILATRAPSRALAIAERTGILALILPEHETGIAAWAAAREPDRRQPSAGGGDPDGSAGGAGGLPRGIGHDGQRARWLARVDAAAPEARLAALLAELADPDLPLRRLDRRSQRAALAVLRRLKFSNDESAAASVAVGAAAAVLVAEWSDPEIRYLLADVTRGHAGVAVALWRADSAAELADRAAAILDRGDALAVGELAVTGKDLMAALEMSPGPAIGRLLAALLDRVLADPALNTRDPLIAVARGLELELAR
ncbi:MAG: hypothetical protein E6J91_26990 [Deltaproteobacteria bacterium]|nr:MAG: hypothetical protein E6J91_26990 [Deltaproteobacteria bacterium]